MADPMSVEDVIRRALPVKMRLGAATAERIAAALAEAGIGSVAEARRDALGQVRAGLRTGPHLMNEDDHWVSLPYVLDLLDSAAAEQAEKPTST